MYGNYCGPWWSDGKFQTSVIGLTPPVDELDAACQRHDAAYSASHDLKRADLTFAQETYRQGLTGLAMAGAVGLQGLLRRDGDLPMTKKRTNLRGSQTPKTQQQNDQQRTRPNNERAMGLSVPPVSIGSTFRAVAPKVTRGTDSAHLVGHDFVGSVEGQGVSTFGLGKAAALHPAYFSSSMLGTMCKSFERYKWRSLRIHYIPRVASTAVGQVIMTSLKSVSMPQLQGESGTFLQRAMTQGNAVFSPLWTPSYIDIDCDNDWRLVNPLTTADADDVIAEELGIFTQVAVSGQVGYLWAEYTIDFKGAIYQPQAALIPVPTGPGLRVTLQDAVAINPSGNDVVLADVGNALLGSLCGGGAIYRFIIDYPTVIPGAGTTAANMWHIAVRSFDTLTGTGVVFQNYNLPVVGGMAVYLKYLTTGNVLVFTSLEAAVASAGNGQAYYRTANSTSGSLSGDAYLIRMGEVQLTTGS